MKRIYKNQGKLRLTVNTGCNLNGWNTLELRYRKPNGDTGVFDVDILDEEKGIIYHDFNGELDQCGTWLIWSYILFDDDRNIVGKTQKFHVCQEEPL